MRFRWIKGFFLQNFWEQCQPKKKILKNIIYEFRKFMTSEGTNHWYFVSKIPDRLLFLGESPSFIYFLPSKLCFNASLKSLLFIGPFDCFCLQTKTKLKHVRAWKGNWPVEKIICHWLCLSVMQELTSGYISWLARCPMEKIELPVTCYYLINGHLFAANGKERCDR